ncbi:hypothetical protein O181_127856 [Austropuccinia psidii MF-1]|uniref:DUF4939 domain-containing protein n=1 Tax=Austropuccinia psidii MF-1 TaxID=1389203 RepID=A0A9Q3Q758_9BASI|nr:hypothetical protein [Austropuccinia psidii MF-1]
MGQLTQAVAPRDTSKGPAFNTPSIKTPDSFYGTKAYKLREFIQSCQLIFHNDPANFFSDRKDVLFSTSFLTDRAEKWIEPYFSNICNEDPSYLLNNWQLFETQLFTLFGDPNEVRKAEQELDNLRMKESGQVSLYIADFRFLMSRIGDWGKGPILILQELMDITLELDTRYHERQKEKGSNQEKKPPISGSNSCKPPQSSSSREPYHRKNKKGKNFKCPKTSLMLISSIRTTNELVLKRRGGLKKACSIIVVESTHLKNASRGLRIGRGHQKASLASRENPEWES